MSVEVGELHPQFISLHAALTGEFALVDMLAAGTPARTLLHLYPVHEASYLPYFRARFARHRAQISADPARWLTVPELELYGWEFRQLLHRCELQAGTLDPAAAVLQATDEVYTLDSAWDSKVADLLESECNSAAAKRYGAPWYATKLRSEVRDVMNLTHRLARWSQRAYLLLPRRERAELNRVISDLPRRVRVTANLDSGTQAR